MGHHQPCRAFGTWVSGPGKSTQGDDFAGIGELPTPRVIPPGRIIATVIPCSCQSNRDRAELVALRRLEMVEDCVRVVDHLATWCGMPTFGFRP
jgi:hypothetical protein